MVKFLDAYTGVLGSIPENVIKKKKKFRSLIPRNNPTRYTKVLGSNPNTYTLDKGSRFEPLLGLLGLLGLLDLAIISLFVNWSISQTSYNFDFSTY